MKVKAFYLSLILTCFILQSCDNKSDEVKDEEYYVTQKDLDDLDNEPKDPSGGVTFSKNEFQGMKLYMHHCNRCHPAGGKGKGPSLVDKKMLPDFLIHFQVRNGLGDMPKFTKEKLPKENVKKIVSFIRLLREYK